MPKAGMSRTTNGFSDPQNDREGHDAEARFACGRERNQIACSFEGCRRRQQIDREEQSGRREQDQKLAIRARGQVRSWRVRKNPAYLARRGGHQKPP
jgi:hypothetical protein